MMMILQGDKMRTYLAFAVAAAAGFSAETSFAQISSDEAGTDTVPVESEPMPKEPAPAAAPVPAPVAPTPADSDAEEVEQEDEYEEIGSQGGARFRWGVS